MNALPFTAYTLSVLTAMAQSSDGTSPVSVRPTTALAQAPSALPVAQPAGQKGLPVPAPSSPEVASQPESTSKLAKSFKDMADHPLEAVVTALALQGIVKGFPDGTFRPNEPISSVDWSTLVRKAKVKLGSESSLAVLNSIQPAQRSLTRGNAAQLIYQALSKTSDPIQNSRSPQQEVKASSILPGMSGSTSPNLPASPSSPASPNLPAPAQLSIPETPDFAAPLSPVPVNSQLSKPIAGKSPKQMVQHWTSLCKQTPQATAEALAACDQLVGSNPADASNWIARGDVLVSLGKHAEAAASYDRALSLQTNHSHLWVQQCRTLLALDQPERALAACDRALAINRNWGNRSPALAWYHRAIALTRANQLEAAIAAYDQVLARFPKDAITWTQRGVVFAQRGQYQEALNSYEQAIKANSAYSLAHLNRCTVLNQLGRYEEALAACDQAMNGDGRWGSHNPAEVWDQRGQALAGLNRLEEALSASNQAIALAPKNPDFWNNQAVIFWRMKRFEEALNASERAIALNPTYPEGWFNQGRILRSLERDEAALAAYDRAIDALQKTLPAPGTPALADIWANRSVVLWKLGRYTDALKSADRAIGVQSNYAPGWYNRGVVLTAMNQPEAAIKSYQKALDLNPNADYAWTGQGIALEQLGRHEAAIAAFDQALKLNPSQQLAQQNLDTVKLKLEQQKKPAPQTQAEQPSQISL